jgi:hypothetical protein
MPDAETHPQPCVQNEGMHARKSRQVRRTFRHSLRDGLPLIARSPRSPGLIASVALRNVSQDLIRGRSGPHDFAVRGRPASSSVPSASIASRPTFRDHRPKRPLARSGRAEKNMYFGKMEAQYFLRRGLTRFLIRRSNLPRPAALSAVYGNEKEFRLGPQWRRANQGVTFYVISTRPGSDLAQQAISNPRTPAPSETRRRPPRLGRPTGKAGEWRPASRRSWPARAKDRCERARLPRGRARNR